jgi:hypothetical protein
MRGFLFAVLVVARSACCADNANEIVLRSLDRDSSNFERLKNYTYEERNEARQYDKSGKLKTTEIEVYEIMMLGGRHYERLISKDDKPLSEKQARKEQEKIDKELERRSNMSPAEKAKREKERAEQRRFLRELPEAFRLRVIGEENVSGNAAWVIQAEPNPGYRPKLPRANLFSKVRAKIWIDKADYQWVKAEAEVIDTISFGLGMLRIAPGGFITFEQTRVNDEVWLPSHITVRADARLALLKKLRGQMDITYSKYQKFQSDSRIVE